MSEVRSQTGLLLGQSLKRGLEPLAQLIHTTQTQSSDYGFFSHLCNFVVPFIRKTSVLKGIRDAWTAELTKYSRETRSLKLAIVREIVDACQTLKSRVKKSRIKARQSVLKVIDEVEDILATGGQYLGPEFYELAADRLGLLCGTLARDGRIDILAGIADVGYRDKTGIKEGEVWSSKEPYLEQVHFKDSLIVLSEHRKAMGWDRVDNCWAVWEYLCLAEQCWHLSQSYFTTQKQIMGTVNKVQQSNQVFNLRCYWWEIQGIRQQCKSDHSPIVFTRKRYSAYLEHLTSAIVFFCAQEGMTNSEEVAAIYAVELKVHQNELHLLVEWHQGGEISVYILHICQESSVPLRFLQKLFDNVGNKVSIEEIDPDGQSVAKVLTALGIEQPLRKLFFPQNQTKTATLVRTRVILIEQVGVDPIKITQYIASLGLQQLEGPFSRINYERFRRAHP